MISRNIFKTLFVFAAGAALIASCDSEYNDIGADIIEGDIHHNGMTRYEGSVVAYDHATGGVQSNNLPLNVLGIYDNPAFGKTTAHFVTQLELASENPKFHSPVIDSVYLYVPYFSTLESTDGTTGDSTYELDSIYGNQDAEMTLKIYRNGYFLRNTDPGSETTEAQKYYSSELFAANGVHATSTIQSPLVEINNFKFSDDEVLRIATVNGAPKTIERFGPGIYTLLDNATFQNALMGPAAQNKLTNNNLFKEYFRGLYFNITQNGSSGAMANTRFSEGRIVIIYKDYTLNTDGVTFDTESDKVRKTITLNMKGNAVNFFENAPASGFQAGIASSNVALGDSRLYLKGGDGSMGVIKILNNEDIATLTADRVLINEANLIFYVDQTKMGASPNPLRLYLYDLENNAPLFDYYADATTNSFNSKYDKAVFGGLLSKGILNEQQVVRYKIRITNHVKNIIAAIRDGEENALEKNVPLGLVLSENINVISNAALKTPFGAGLVDVKTVPATSVISPLGTVLYGNRNDNDNSVPEDMRLKLEIFYTKPN
ncbi:MAG: DUF4270 domain-containing protein [Flavobacterium sp.]